MASILPPIPRLVFAVLEPISLVAGFILAVADPEWFVNEQIPSSPRATLAKNSITVALQLGNLYLLLALMGVAILYTTTEAKIVRNYLIVLWIADIGHIVATCHGLGFDRFTDISSWNTMTWGNIAATAFFNVNRVLYLLGLFEPGQKNDSGTLHDRKAK